MLDCDAHGDKEAWDSSPAPDGQTSLKIQELPMGQPRADIPGVSTVAFATLWGSPHTLLGLFFDLLCYQTLFPSAQPSFTLSSALKRVRVGK